MTKIRTYPFDKTTPERLQKQQYGSDWPVVYIINNKEEAYIGETVDASVRTAQHLENPERRKLTDISIIGDDRFNKSAILDLESFLIRYMSSDQKFKLQNGNMGMRSHRYYDKANYEESFKTIWDLLKGIGLTQRSLAEIQNSDLFKYSPYKSLSSDQYLVVYQLLQDFADAMENGTDMTAFVHGGPGTGKTILAIFMMRLMKGKTYKQAIDEDELDATDVALYKTLERLSKFPDIKIGLVIPVTSFCKTIKRIFGETSGLSGRMVYSTTEVSKEKFDLLIVDEAHRLRQRKAIMQYATFDQANARLGFDKTGTELDWVLKQSKHRIFFYDAGQSIKPSDVDRMRFKELEKQSGTVSYYLESQFRCMGGMDYINYVHNILEDNTTETKQKFVDYEFTLFDDPNQMIDAIRKKDAEYGLCRTTAGYAWEWKSQHRVQHELLEDVYDFDFNGRKYIWNTHDNDWVYTEESVNEIGCVHTTQGYDLNYNGVLFGKEIDYDFSKNCFVIDRSYYFDRNGQATVHDDEVLKDYILNIYTILLTRGIRGTYMCAMNPNMQKYLSMFANNVKPLI